MPTVENELGIVRRGVGVLAQWDKIALLTMVLAILAAIQAWAFIQAERTILTIGTIAFEPVADKPIKIKFTVRNGGRQTAFVDLLRFNVRRKALLADPDYLGSGSIVAPPIVGESEARMTFDALAPGDILTGAEIEEIKNGTLRFYAFGFIRYRDTFSLPWWPKTTGFCFVYNPAGDPTSPFDTCDNPNYTYAN